MSLTVMRRPCSIATSSGRAQRGAATLIVVLILFFVISLVAAYTNRNLIFEQRTASNQYRSTQAQEAAEAGLEWTTAVLNLGKIDDSCVASTATTDLPFRERFLNIDSTGRITPKTLAGGGEMTASCVFTGSGWQCSCSGNGTVSIPATAGSGIYPAFKVRFKQIIDRAGTFVLAPRQPSAVSVQVVACTRPETAGDQCLTFTGVGAAGEGRVQVADILALTGTASSLPQAALVAKGDVDAPISAYNSSINGSGVTVQAKGTVSGFTQLVSLPGSAGGTASTIQNDTNLALPNLGGSNAISSAERMFAAVFNLRSATFKEQPASVQLPCGGSGCSASTVRSTAAAQPWRPIWLSGDFNVDSAGDIGSATQPVLLVVNGDLKFSVSTATIYGLVYVKTTAGQWTTTGGGQVTGGTIVDGDVTGSGTTTFVFDPTVMRLIRWNTGSFVRVPGAWRDFECAPSPPC